MRIHAAQLPVTTSLSANVCAIRDAIGAAASGDLLVTVVSADVDLHDTSARYLRQRRSDL